MNIKEAKSSLEQLSLNEQQRDALDTLYSMAIERDEALKQAEHEHNLRSELRKKIDRIAKLSQECAE